MDAYIGGKRNVVYSFKYTFRDSGYGSKQDWINEWKLILAERNTVHYIAGVVAETWSRSSSHNGCLIML